MSIFEELFILIVLKFQFCPDFDRDFMSKFRLQMKKRANEDIFFVGFNRGKFIYPWKNLLTSMFSCLVDSISLSCIIFQAENNNFLLQNKRIMYIKM